MRENGGHITDFTAVEGKSTSVEPGSQRREGGRVDTATVGIDCFVKEIKPFAAQRLVYMFKDARIAWVTVSVAGLTAAAHTQCGAMPSWGWLVLRNSPDNIGSVVHMDSCRH